MKNSTVIHSQGPYRILEVLDLSFDLSDLKGDCYNFELTGYTGTREQLKQEEKEFERTVKQEGVYGYVLQAWNPAVDAGWESVESCWGFVGQYDQHKHDFVDELKSIINSNMGA